MQVHTGDLYCTTFGCRYQGTWDGIVVLAYKRAIFHFERKDAAVKGASRRDDDGGK